MARHSKQEKAEAIESLRAVLAPGDMVYTVLRSVSRSGMSRDFDVYSIDDNRPDWLTSRVAKALGLPRKGDVLRVSGCGMDMGFHVVYSLSRALFSHGFGCIGERCPSNDHTNGDRDYTPHVGGGLYSPGDKASLTGTRLVGESGLVTVEGIRAGYHWHADGGYALRHSWL